MRKRKATPEEPRTASPIYAHLGMTKGAMIAFLLFFAVVMFGFVRTEQLASRQRQASNANKAAIKAQRQVLAEVCRQSHVVQGVVTAEVSFIEVVLAHRIVSVGGVDYLVQTVPGPSYIRALETLRGFQLALNESASCPEVTNP